MNLSAAFAATATKRKDPAIAATIFQQMGGMGRLSAMVGARYFLDHGNGGSFQFRMSRKYNFFHVTLDADDTYSLRFAKLGKWGDVKGEKNYHGIYAEQLKPLFERETGLRLTL